MSIKVFISYAHDDQTLCKKLEQHLSALSHSGKITIWQDQKIPAGANWENQIHTYLNEADLILLLVSASFIASRYCWSKEVYIALQRHKAGVARVVPIILRPVYWQNTPLGQLQALPTGALPITQWTDQDAAFENVVQGIGAIVEHSPITSPQETQYKKKTPAQKKSIAKALRLSIGFPLLIVGALVLISLLSLLFFSFIPMTTTITTAQATASATVLRATEIRACMQQHGLEQAHTTTKQGDSQVTFASCDWPPPAYAGPDGYSEIKVVTVQVPGQGEATGTDLADRITASCQKLQISYTFGSQGFYTHQPPFTVSADGLYLSNGTVWLGSPSMLNFYPARGEIVVLHNAKNVLDSAMCV